MSERRDEFLSDEDLDLKNLTALELETYWRLWLTQAQGTNDADRASYSHGVFERDPSVSLLTDRGAPTDSQPFRLATVGGGGPRPGIDLDRTSGLIVAEDEASHGGESRGR